jgi:hypothetical protein
MSSQRNNKKLSKVLSTKLSVEDYDAFQTLTKLEYQAGLIKEPSPSELLRFTIRHILINQLNSNPQYRYLLVQQQQKQDLITKPPINISSTTIRANNR